MPFEKGYTPWNTFKNKEDRFWKRVDKGKENECWEWRAGKTRKVVGYGSFFWNNKRILSHRYSWEFHFGKIPKGNSVLHKCDNSICVNPNHLYLGTQADNCKDMAKRERKEKTLKITNDGVKLIRELYKNRPELTHSRISEEFGISRPHITCILNGTKRVHV